jgi:O-acetyl-ADP-ribose deacetylase (regulator of RNase III)
MTPGFALPARWVIHAVGPVWNGGESGEAELLASAYRAAFSLADQSELSTIALPSISTGIYGFPVALAAPIALSSISEALATAHSTREATFVLFDEATLSAYENALAQV